MDRIAEYYFNLEVAAEALPMLLQGLVFTIFLGLLTIIFGLIIGLGGAVLRSYQIRPVNYLLIFLVDALRAVPPLVLLVVAYFALPYVGVRMSPFVATVAVLAMVLAAFAEEIYWAGITSVPKGQWEAARATGLGFTQTLGYVVMPHAVRLVIPPLTNRTIAITKLTALGSVVSAQEILNQATAAQTMSANPTPLTLGALLYIMLFIPLTVFSRWCERRFGWQG